MIKDYFEEMLLIVVTLSTLVSLAHTAPHGCSHDGNEYRVNQKITIGCDECVCLPGENEMLTRITI